MDEEDLASHRTNFTWEQQYQRSWDAIKEDAQGSLSTAIHQLQFQRRKPKSSSSSSALIRRGIIRHIFLVIDGSRSSVEETDFHPTRLGCLLKILESHFVPRFFSQNCLGQLGVVLIREGIGEKICELTGSCTQVQEALKRIPSIVSSASSQADNFPSIQNGLALAVASLQLFSKACSFGEILLCYSSVFTVDPGNLLLWLKEQFNSQHSLPVRISVLALGGELWIAKQVALQTFGSFCVPLNEADLKEELLEFLQPPADLFPKSTVQLTEVGFPKMLSQNEEAICCCHAQRIVGTTSMANSNADSIGFWCPRCLNVNCMIPGECAVCGLLLVQNAHISRSFASLFQVQTLEMIKSNDDGSNKFLEGEKVCSGCGEDILDVELGGVFRCVKCEWIFCGDCEILIREQLLICPGCE